MNPVDIALPNFLDPVLSYLSDALPPPLYALLINILSHALALLTAVFALITSLLSTNPLQWDAQTVLPPLISVFAAYLALLSLYRTTSWMLRTSLWFIKWGTLLGALFASAGWYMGNANGNGVGSYGIASSIGGFVLDMINGQGQNAAGSTRSRSRTYKPHPRPSKKKPKIWESFERHREWQYQEGETGADETIDAQKIIKKIVGTAGRAVTNSEWWNIAKRMVDGGDPSSDKSRSNDETRGRLAKAKARGSRSR